MKLSGKGKFGIFLIAFGILTPLLMLTDSRFASNVPGLLGGDIFVVIIGSILLVSDFRKKENTMAQTYKKKLRK